MDTLFALIGLTTFSLIASRPRGLMDKASDFESEDCEFESRRGHTLYFWKSIRLYTVTNENDNEAT